MTTAAVKRAVMASLDRIRAERRLEVADENYSASVQLEKLSRVGLSADEDYEYGVTLTHVLNAEQEAGRL